MAVSELITVISDLEKLQRTLKPHKNSIEAYYYLELETLIQKYRRLLNNTGE